MASSSKNFHARSNSFPSTSHPSTIRVDEELNKLRALDASTTSTSNSIYNRLSGLEDLYIFVDDLLNLPSTQQIFSQHGHEKCVEELLDASVRTLDVCEITWDMLVELKEQIKGLQSALRRRKDDSSIHSTISSFMSFRKNMKKNFKNSITTLKQIQPICQNVDLGIQAVAVIMTLREVSFVSVSIFDSLLHFLSVKPKSSRWSLISKLMHKEKVACEDINLQKHNELEDVDAAILCLFKFEAKNEKMQNAQRKLEALDMSIEDFENALDGAFRNLIRVRASILNIVSL